MFPCDRRLAILILVVAACQETPPRDDGSHQHPAEIVAGLDQLPLATGCLDALQTGGTPRLPAILTDTGCVTAADPKQPIEGFIPYDINLPFWTDGAKKQRYLALPAGKKIVVLANGDWDLPVGSVVLKTFQLGERMVETRFLVRRAEEPAWSAFTYQWNEQQTSAVLTSENRTIAVGEQNWQIPAGVCTTCHTDDARMSLGIETAQMNREITYPSTGRRANQIATLAHLGVLEGLPSTDVATLPRYPDPKAAEVPIDERARAYLHVNCSHCHRPSNHCPLTDMRYDTSLAMTRLCNQTDNIIKLGRELGAEDARPIVPGVPERSLVLLRMREHRLGFRMPLWGSLAVHDEGAALIEEWVNSLTECPELPLPPPDPHGHDGPQCPRGENGLPAPHCPARPEQEPEPEHEHD